MNTLDRVVGPARLSPADQAPLSNIMQRFCLANRCTKLNTIKARHLQGIKCYVTSLRVDLRRIRRQVVRNPFEARVLSVPLLAIGVDLTKHKILDGVHQHLESSSSSLIDSRAQGIEEPHEPNVRPTMTKRYQHRVVTPVDNRLALIPDELQHFSWSTPAGLIFTQRFTPEINLAAILKLVEVVR